MSDSQRIARIDGEDELLAHADEIIAAASAKLKALCHGERWRMSVPVHDDDSDVALGAVIRLASVLRRRLHRARRANAETHISIELLEDALRSAAAASDAEKPGTYEIVGARIDAQSHTLVLDVHAAHLSLDVGELPHQLTPIITTVETIGGRAATWGGLDVLTSDVRRTLAADQTPIAERLQQHFEREREPITIERATAS